jgi:hypothetical protein
MLFFEIALALHEQRLHPFDSKTEKRLCSLAYFMAWDVAVIFLTVNFLFYTTEAVSTRGIIGDAKHIC